MCNCHDLLPSLVTIETPFVEYEISMLYPKYELLLLFLILNNSKLSGSVTTKTPSVDYEILNNLS